MRHWYMVALDSEDTRPEAAHRLGLELGRALHLQLDRGEVWSVDDPFLGEAVLRAEAVRYDPARTVEQQIDG